MKDVDTVIKQVIKQHRIHEMHEVRNWPKAPIRRQHLDNRFRSRAEQTERSELATGSSMDLMKPSWSAAWTRAETTDFPAEKDGNLAMGSSACTHLHFRPHLNCAD